MRYVLIAVCVGFLLSGCATTCESTAKSSAYRALRVGGMLHSAISFSTKDHVCYTGTGHSEEEAAASAKYACALKAPEWSCTLWMVDYEPTEYGAMLMANAREDAANWGGALIGATASAGQVAADYNVQRQQIAAEQQRERSASANQYQAQIATQNAPSVALQDRPVGVFNSGAQNKPAGSGNVEYVDARDSSDCLRIEHNSISGFFVNKCSYPLNVDWFDQGHCSNRCNTWVRADDKETIPQTQGTVHWAACPSPASVENSWTGQGNYRCLK